MSDARGSNTRDRLLDAAETEFARYGYAGAHLQSIAEKVGVQKTALYYYFASKAAFYSAVIVRMLEDFASGLMDVVVLEGSYRERMAALVDAFNDVLAAHPNYAPIIIRLFIDPASVDYDKAGPPLEQLIGRVLSFYSQGVEAGEFRKGSARHFFQSLVGTTVFHYASPVFSAGVLRVDDVFAPEAVAWRRQEARRFVLDGVLAETGGD